MGRKMREDLHGGSDVLKQLQERQLNPTSHALMGAASQRITRYYNLAGTLDVMVLPSKHITSKKAFWSCWLPHVGHYSILMSETLWDQVTLILAPRFFIFRRRVKHAAGGVKWTGGHGPYATRLASAPAHAANTITA